MSEELKACPFCGGAGYQHKHFWEVVTCQNCSADGPAGDTEAEAIAAWNTRALDATLTARLATVEAERDAALSEALEQSRLLGMGGSREARLMAERNAAVARAEALADNYSKPFAAQVTEGERRATAAIVAHVRACAASFEAAAKSSANAGMRDHLAYAGDACFRYRVLADAIEAGDHLPSAGDAGEGND